ncbi:MAG: Cobalamin-binding radical SAM protein [Candidatus Magasanikbacteria bacterium GW2011_GWC2_41_17]|uniref:Cobalamin-binding radical SAM protein n=2 Tax=Candidatus Magasanikiibacteriota TaxID=1752731 RepID=A0A0G0ZL04_9BACT|nr:MAG: Cobalamin-binding radical SAM protein [Candidatus Magasanikbacteria bacterium GW2011_GWC2_41_17]KKS13638.1 MAG: Cobalamin-binding radical SAM protein [Candidatus Magasanikbacteria bacterium GW2011_GWA2_41_55]
MSPFFCKKNKVLFIIHDLYQDDNRFPLGPAYLAAVLDKNGAQVEVYCMDVFHYTNEQLAQHLQNNHYDLIGLGFSAARFVETVLELCRVINQNKKDAWLVLGGHGPSPIPEYILKATGVDIVAIGEAENTIIDLLNCKINHGDLSKVNGIAYLENERFKVTAPNRPIIKLDELPFPLWQIFPMKIYVECNKMFRQSPGEKSMSLVSSRGCINRCNFCYRMEKGIRLRSVDSIIGELKILYHQYGVNNYFFEDELFVLNKSRLLKFEKGLIENGLKIKFFCNARVDIMDEDTVEVLKRCGCQFIGFGFESSNDHVLKLMNKNATVEQNLRALEVVKKVGGIGMGLNFIWNNLGDDEETLKRNVELIKKYNTFYQCRTIRPVTPYPGSDLYYQLIKMGKIKGPEDFFDKYYNSDLIFKNLMNMSDEKAYELLLEANTELIRDHFNHVGDSKGEAEKLIKQFADLYSGKSNKFRGSRHYTK